MLLFLNDHSPEPLHSQVTRQVGARILAGELAEGDALPSIRKLAESNEVSVITIKRAYADMEREGLIRSARRKGFTVAPLTLAQKTSIARERFDEKIGPIIRDGLETGMTMEQIRKSIERFLKEEGGKK
jgi:GntR family transcriptional regulator